MEKNRFTFSVIFLFCVVSCLGESITIVKNSAKEYISSHFEGTSKFWVTELKIVGEMNGKDVLFIKEIATSEKNGNLTTLDLSEASFVDVDGLEEAFKGKEANKTYSSSSIYNGLTKNYHDVYKKYLGDDKYDTYYFGYHIVWEEVDHNFFRFELVSVEKIDINSICGHFFEGCDKLTSVILPSNTSGIGNNAFTNCTNLTTLNITDGVKFIGNYAFQGCAKLQEIKLPVGLTSIGSNAFDGCTALSSIVIPDNVKTMGAYIFQNCTGLKSAKLTDNLEIIPFGLFHKCKNLKAANIPQNCTKISTYSFQNCGLDSVIIPKSVKKIEESAFWNCPFTHGVYVMSEMPPEYDSKASRKNTTLYVPKGCIERYSLSPGWKEFGTILEMPELNNKKCEKPTISYTNNKLVFSSKTEGVSFISNISDTDIKTYSNNKIELSLTYNITVYAKKNGYEDSDIATATLCWIDTEPKSEGLSDGITQIHAKTLLIQTENGQISITGTDDGTKINAYEINGTQIGSAISYNGHATLTTNLKVGSIVIMKIGDKSVKVAIK